MKGMYRHNGRLRTHLLRKLLKDAGRVINQCEKCGKMRKSKQPLTIHHKDGDFTNNTIENLAVLCKTCHEKIHNVKSPYAQFEYSIGLLEFRKHEWNPIKEYPYCSVHGAMNKVSKFGLWRCLECHIGFDETTNMFLANSSQGFRK